MVTVEVGSDISGLVHAPSAGASLAEFASLCAGWRVGGGGGGGFAGGGGVGRGGHGEGVGLACGQADVGGNGGAGPGGGGVGEQQPGDALAFAGGGGGVVPDRGQVGGQLADPGFLGVGELPGVVLAGLLAGVLGLAEGAQRGVPVGFEGVGDEPVGGVDGEVAAAGQVGVVAGALDVGGAQRAGLVGAVLEFGLDGEGGFDGERGEGVDEQLPDLLVQAGAGDGLADPAGV